MKKSDELLKLATKVEQLENSLFFMGEVLESLHTENYKFEQSNDITDLNKLQNTLSRVLPNVLSFTTNSKMETEEIASQLYVISDEVEDMEKINEKNCSK